ncbi:hypothetical protein [Anditalea andensis]|uniref:hypothetical protein n=1 Tax=Anditalea andensis TaxID=1048983 RepID=UPI0013DF07EF|nr:hypothetical protein [Anditalea andensis]
MQVLIVAVLLIIGWMLSEIQTRHIAKPFLSTKGFALLSFASFFMFTAFDSVQLLVEF